MNKNSWNIILYIIIITLIVGALLKLLPYLVVFGLVTWGIVKIYRFFNRKSNNGNDTEGSAYNYNAQEYKEDVPEDNTEDINEAIDVEYKDV